MHLTHDLQHNNVTKQALPGGWFLGIPIDHTNMQPKSLPTLMEGC